MNSLKLKNKISKIKITRDWHINKLGKEQNRFVENIHSEAWARNVEKIQRNIRKYYCEKA